jgi:hypothetical protein
MQNVLKCRHSCFCSNDNGVLERLFFREKFNFLYFAFFILNFTFVLSSCTQLENAKETAAIKNTVMSYNKMLIEAAKTGDVEPLKGILAQKEKEKLNHWIASWHDSHVYMDGKIEHIEFKNITLSGSTATVITAEDWTYEYKNLETRQLVQPASGIYYDMEYLVLKKDNTWIIHEIKVKSEKKKKEKGDT